MGWLSGYQYRKKVTISGSSGAGENYQVKLRIGSSSGGDFHLEGHCIDFPNDIRFTDDDGETLLDYWIEDSTQDPITVWVKVKDNLDNNVDIYCYYGKSGESSASNGSATFEFFDDTEQTVGEGVVITSWSFNAIGYVIEWKAETPSSDGFGDYLTDALGDYNGANFYVDDGGNGKVQEYDGNMHTIADSYSEPVILVAKLISTSTLDYQVYNPDRTLAGEITGANYRGSPTRIDTLFTGSSSKKNWQTHFHWLFIRKYASPEPSFSSVGSEEIEHLTCIDVVRSSDTAFGGGPIQRSCTDILDSISFSSRCPPWLPGFTYRRAIKISGSSGAGTGYQVRLKIGSSSEGDFHLNGHCDNFPNDIRFTKNDGISLLDYWIEDPSQDPITVWIEIEDNLNENVSIFCYYGSSLAESESDGSATFEFFEDFESGDVEYVATPSNKTTDGFWYAAPKVTVADNGDWIMCYSNGDEVNSTEVGIGISTDNGETWTNKGLISNNPNYFCAQPLIIKYPNGKLQCFWCLRDATKNSSTPEAWGGTEVSTSTDNGQTWSSPEHAHPTLDNDNIVAWQAVTIGNTVYLSAVAHVGDPIVFKNALYKTEDNGETWTKVGDITPSGYTEGGMVYLGDGEFVVVSRDNSKQHTLQRRSTDYGETWTTDGYIKTDGSLGSSPGGSDLILHHVKIYNLGGYILMKASRYPGSYPRDVMIYFSTDNCASWGAGASEIYHQSQGTEGEYVSLTSEAGKLVVGQNNRCDISVEKIFSPPSGWIVTGEDIAEFEGVTSPVKHGNYAGRWHWKTAGEAYAYKTIPELRDQDKIIEFWRRGGGYSGEDVTSSVIGLDKTSSDKLNGIKLYYNAEDHEFQYYDDTLHTILSGVDDSQWYKFGVKVFSDGDDSKFDLWIDDEKKVTGGGTRGSVNSVILFQFQFSTSKEGWIKEYVDAIRVRKHVEPEPSFSSAQAEEGPVFTCGDVLTNLSKNWWATHVTSSDILNSSSISSVHREIFPVCLETLSCSDVLSSILSLISRSQASLGLIDSGTSSVTLLLNAIDSIDVSDGCTLSFSFTSSCLDVLHAIDSASYPLPNVVSCLDSLGTQDSISSFLSMLCQSKDNIGGADGETSQLSVERVLLDILTFHDTSSYLAAIIASASDVLNIQDLNNVRLTFSCSSIDVVKNIDGGGVNVTFHLSGDDILKGADYVSGNLEVLLDSLAVFKNTDQSASSLLGFILRSASDVLDMYDLNTATLQISSSSIDIFRIEDNSSINITLHLDSADIFKNSDSTILSLQALLSALETLRASDSSTASVFAEILASASDLLATSDFDTIHLEFLESAIDIVESVDSTSSNITLHLNSSDLLGGMDRVAAKLEALLSAISKFKSSDESRTYEVIHGVPVKIFKVQPKVLVFKAE